jgi:hypothetical protein
MPAHRIYWVDIAVAVAHCEVIFHGVLLSVGLNDLCSRRVKGYVILGASVAIAFRVPGHLGRGLPY